MLLNIQGGGLGAGRDPEKNSPNSPTSLFEEQTADAKRTCFFELDDGTHVYWKVIAYMNVPKADVRCQVAVP